MGTDPIKIQRPGGVFQLKTPVDLYYKLDRELQRLREAPDDPDIAFNFFVTAWHILDWLHPGREGEPQRKRLREGSPLLRLMSHLANGAKHFVVFEHIKSVNNPHGLAVRKPIPGAKSRFLTIQIDADARDLFESETPYVMDVAYRVWGYWREYFAVNGLLK
jgi:hypothetical protein